MPIEILGAMSRANRDAKHWFSKSNEQALIRRVNDPKHYTKRDRLFYAMLLTAWGY